MRLISSLSAFLILSFFPVSTFGQVSLWLLEKRIALKYDVQNITAEELHRKLSSKEPGGILIFDTRQKEEYDTSRIQKAIHVGPDMSTDVFIENQGHRIKGKILIFYCSVGVRSSMFIERVRERALKEGAVFLANLRGGIVRWYNDGYPVLNGEGETDDIHPFDDSWGRFVKPRGPK
jgi:rhodanese-related sulfurtransferase